MSVSASNIPVSVDYTSKDYYSIREELIARIQDRIPEWNAEDPADFGVALVEAFAYLGDLMSYYIDRNVNESFIGTATQRQSVLDIAQTYGYTPAGYRQAFTSLTFTNSSNTEVLIPAGTVVSGEVIINDAVKEVYFTTQADCAVIEMIGGTAGEQTVSATEGRSVTLVVANSNEYGELIGTSTGKPGQVFKLSQAAAVDTSIEIYVEDGGSYSKWVLFPHLLDAYPTDLAFETYTDDDDTVYITFGDGVSGSIPTLAASIRAKYTISNGELGNVKAATLDTFSYIPGTTASTILGLGNELVVTNEFAAIGGGDPEDLNQIRTAAPISLRANSRAVTLQDYADLALGVSGVGKASAAASVWSSVTVYISPSKSLTDTDTAPGLNADGSTTIEYATIKDLVTDYLADKILLGTSVTIQPPTYIDAVLTVQYSKFDQYTTVEVETGLKTKLLTSFGYNGVNFQDTIYPQDLEFELAQVPGIKVVRVTRLTRTGITLSGVASGTVVTYTSNIAHGLSVGSTVYISGFSTTGFNLSGAIVASVTDSTHFTVNNTLAAASSTGTGLLSAYSTLVGAASEIFRFSEDNTTLGAV
jgi:hypothetical protein